MFSRSDHLQQSEMSPALYVTIYTTSTPHSVNTKHFNKHFLTVVSSTIRSLRSIACRKQSFHLVAGSVPIESLPSVTAEGICITWSSNIMKSVQCTLFSDPPSLPKQHFKNVDFETTSQNHNGQRQWHNVNENFPFPRTLCTLVK